MQHIKLELEPAVFGNLKALVIAGGKAMDTGENGIMAAAQMLQILAQAAQDAEAARQKPANGHAEQHVSH
jgi:hypothetical protein